MNGRPLKKRVIVGMSGGVDSSVAALLLQQQGYDVEGVFMKNWEDDDREGHCQAANDVKDAEAITNLLKIPLHTVNFSQSYWDNVFEHFLKEYQLGRTPNPDILCNREIKFKLFLNYALNLGADYIATGHYAKNISLSQSHYELHKADDPNKDQSYFLYTLTQQALSKTLFPLSAIPKDTVRKLAKEAGFLNYEKKDSTGICFIGERKFTPFLKRYLKTNPGNMETPEGDIIGQHEGLLFYTIGQRQGLHIGGRAKTNNEPWYVVKKDLERNVLIVAQGDNHPWLFMPKLIAKELHWIAGTAPHNVSGASGSDVSKVSDILDVLNVLDLLDVSKNSFACSAKIRYRQANQDCVVTLLDDGSCEVHFTEPQRAVTPGQAIVFYQGDHCLGGGTIQ